MVAMRIKDRREYDFVVDHVPYPVELVGTTVDLLTYPCVLKLIMSGDVITAVAFTQEDADVLAAPRRAGLDGYQYAESESEASEGDHRARA
jgi:hypothetical protein